MAVRWSAGAAPAPEPAGRGALPRFRRGSCTTFFGSDEHGLGSSASSSAAGSGIRSWR